MGKSAIANFLRMPIRLCDCKSDMKSAQYALKAAT